jgi:spore coat polysaccharide biosynthesis protein SpsF
MSNDVVAVVQARMNSSRLPGKVLVDVCGHPLIERVIARVSAASLVTKVVVATTEEFSDDELVDWCMLNHIDVFRGSVDDVLQRFSKCLAEYAGTYVVRVTADDPLKDPAIIDQAIRICLNDPSLDYVSNTLHPTFPEGLDIEVIKRSALLQAAKEAMLKSEREHVTPYIYGNPDKFKLHNFTMEPNLSTWRWTVDKPTDLDFIREIYRNFANQPLASYRDIISWIETRPDLIAINAGTVRNEGYLKSLAQDIHG